MSFTEEQNILLSIFYKGISNNDYFQKGGHYTSNIRQLLKIIRMYFYRLISKKVICESDSVLLVWDPLHEKILSNHSGEKIVLLDHPSILSGNIFLKYLSIYNLISLFFKIPKQIFNKKYVYEWLLFSSMHMFLKKNNIQLVTIAGHYDLYATWISYLTNELGVYMIISQHGINSRHNLPYKIPVNKVFAFSSAEIDMFRSVILEPENTEFCIKQFQSTIVFSKGNFNETTIAIASQPGYETKVLDLILAIMEIRNDINIIIYSHPADNFRNGKIAYTKVRNFEVIHNERYWDIDFLMVFTSTLAFDYWGCQLFSGKVVCIYDKNCTVSLYDDERSIVLYPDSCISGLRELIS